MKTFWGLLENYQIKIPIIQRDYAHGRKDEHSQDVRNLLLDHLKEALEGNRHVDFDFVYGTVDLDGNERILLPIDGQQRLTTLFLLHWYVNIKESANLDSVLMKFSYETRVSSRDFIRAVVENPPLYEDIQNQSLSNILIDKKWFNSHWLLDPTVQGMLVMLDAIHLKFANLKGEVAPLLTSEQSPITFNFLELEKFGLGDDLYIKMNARGKSLSTFENFKAQFEKILEEEGFAAKSKDFSLMLEKDWTDLLWEYRAGDFTIDQAFVKLFSFLTSSIAIKEKTLRNPRIFSEPFVKPEELKRIYSEKGNVEFLFASLSLWTSKEEINKYFNIISNDISLFSADTQIFDACVSRESNLNLVERIYFYTIIQKKLNGQESDVVDTLRVIRNLVQRIRQINNGQINSNLRYDTLGPIFRTIDQLIATGKPIYDAILMFDSVEGFADSSWKQEREKAEFISKHPEFKKLLWELEDISVFKGAIHQLLPIFKRYPNETVKFAKALLKLPDSLIARAMLTIEDYAVRIGWSNLGPRYVFGGSYYKEFIWTNNDLTDIFTQTFELLIAAPGSSVEEKLNYIIDNNNTWQKNHWAYYFVKYPTMLKGSKLLFAYEDEDENSYAIERLSGVNLQAEHINPFYAAVIEEIDDEEICSYAYSTVRLSDKSSLGTTFNLSFNISRGCWISDGDDKVKVELKKYAENLQDDDLIQIGVSLVRYAHQLSKNSTDAEMSAL